MTNALRTRFDRIIERAVPTEAPETSWLDIQDRPALRLSKTLDTGTIAIIATPTRPVAAQPRMSDPVPYDADKFGPPPSILPSRRTLHPAFAFGQVALLVGCVTGFLWFVSSL